MGELLGALPPAAAPSTLLLFSADHGEMAAEYALWRRRRRPAWLVCSQGSPRLSGRSDAASASWPRASPGPSGDASAALPARATAARHALVQKASLYEASARVPLLLAGPGVPAAPRVVRALATLLDIRPTVQHALRGAAPRGARGAQGRSLLMLARTPRIEFAQKSTQKCARGTANLLLFAQLARAKRFGDRA